MKGAIYSTLRAARPVTLAGRVMSQQTALASSATSGTPTMPPCDYTPPPYKGPTVTEILETRKKHLTPAMFEYYSPPLLLHAGHRQYLFDHTGKRYLDLIAGIVTVSVGHCHPAVVESVKQQLDQLWHTSNIYLHPTIHQYGKMLTDTLPGNLKNVYFVNSGSEANDLALLMARVHTGRFDAVTFRNSYHGASPYTMGLTGAGKSKYPLANGFGVHHVMNPDPYRGLWGGHRDSPVQSLRAAESTLEEGGSVCSSSRKYIAQLQELLDFCVPQGKPAAFFAEPIQGVGGSVQYPLGYLKQAFEMVQERGGLCIADEVQTGFGRTGDHFWGFQGHGVSPDIVTMAKGIGNGYPLAAVVTTPEVAQSLTKAFHFNTYGGNALSSAVGMAVLKTILEDDVQKVSKDVGTAFIKGLGKLRDEFDCIGDVRGKGLMIGVEMVKSQSCHTPMGQERFLRIWETCKDMGVLLGKGGHYSTHVFRIKPPMCLTHQDVQYALDVLKIVLTADKAANK